jgi:hypothetical protein
MTIAQIIAAKKAAANKGSSVSTPAAIAERSEVKDAIARIDPPSLGKRRAGLVLSASTPLAQADVAEKAHHSELRSLSKSQGEAIPLTPADADKEVATWHEATNSFESSLCIMRDPKEPEVIWLAVRADREGLPPILLHRLPWGMWEHPATARPENEPY